MRYLLPAALGLCLAAVPVASGDSITINQGHLDNFAGGAGAGPGQLSGSFSETVSATSGGDTSTGDYNLSGSGFVMDFSDVRTGGGSAGAQGTIFSTANRDVSYHLAGTYAGNPHLIQIATLSSDDGFLASSYQDTDSDRSTAPQTFTIFGALGDPRNYFGSADGQLFAGHEYSLDFYYFTGDNSLHGEGSDGSATGNLSLRFGDPAAAAVPLPGSAACGLLLLAGYGAAVWLRRRNGEPSA
jgi:hypothetical protein